MKLYLFWNFRYTVARFGSYLHLEKPKPQFLAGHEQVVRIAKTLFIPHSKIALLKLEKPVKFTEYVNTICLPSSEWIPYNKECMIHGTHKYEHNYAIMTTIKDKCHQSK